MNSNSENMQRQKLLDALVAADTDRLHHALLEVPLADMSDVALRLRAVEAQLRYAHLFASQTDKLEAVYEVRPAEEKPASDETYQDLITTYLTTFDKDLDTCEHALEEASTPDAVIAGSGVSEVRQLLQLALTADTWRDQAWFSSRAHITRDGVNESLWSIVSAAHNDVDEFADTIEQAFELARSELAMATNALVPKSHDAGDAA